MLNLWLVLIPAGTKKRYATGADRQAHAARQSMIDALLDRIDHYPMFGPERAREAHGPASQRPG